MEKSGPNENPLEPFEMDDYDQDYADTLLLLAQIRNLLEISQRMTLVVHLREEINNFAHDHAQYQEYNQLLEQLRYDLNNGCLDLMESLIVKEIVFYEIGDLVETVHLLNVQMDQMADDIECSICRYAYLADE
ncbi:uncharacterized protein LOC108040955 [Drosophila rhopaloa]|uniref:Uncharacterized protein LOC108040955 n=1 Tax=Drosophila rhopaloa TaxID=1041015 RepID=A0A6P4ELN1_DRORH|nr:uncharacterized protein LOC108040955 [Drosophila rhopaloa]